jgi:ribulose-phosphate 3-epimerase
MKPGGALVAASVTSADFGNLHHVVRKLERAGVDRLHLDVMDGHFVPNITFGPDIVAAFRRLTRLPLDIHLMISQPSRYVDRFLKAGGDSLTFHVEAPESDAERLATLEAIRAAGRRAGLAISPDTAVEALRPYLGLLDIAMIMTVEPGFGGQRFLTDRAPKISEARVLFGTRDGDWEVHVDGGVNHETASVAGACGADVLVVGSALFERGHDAAREVSLVKAHADAAARALSLVPAAGAVEA